MLVTGKYVMLMCTNSMLLTSITFYCFQKWGNVNHATLEHLENIVSDLYNKKQTELMNLVNKTYLETLKHDIYLDTRVELDNLFLPEHKEDVELKYSMKYAVRDDIQLDITQTVRSSMKNKLRNIIADVISRKTLVDNEDEYPENLCGDKNLPPHQKILVYTVFGDRKLYQEGIPEVLKEAVCSNLYHDWRIRIYHGATISPEIIAKYKHYKNLDFCDARKIPRYGDLTGILGKLWRNIPMGDATVDIMCSRDIDSALLTREEYAVREFLKSERMIHTMRDFHVHDAGMLAGMWCIKTMTNRTMAHKFLETILEEAKSYTLKTDQPLLNKVIFDSIVQKEKYMLQHDAYLCERYKGSVPFPTQREDNMEFVGCPNHVCNWIGLKECPVKCRPENHQYWEYC